MSTHRHIVTHANGNRVDMVFTGVCMFVCFFSHDISNTDAAIESPNLTYKCFAMSPENSFIKLESRSWVTKVDKTNARRGFLHFRVLASSSSIWWRQGSFLIPRDGCWELRFRLRSVKMISGTWRGWVLSCYGAHALMFASSSVLTSTLADDMTS